MNFDSSFFLLNNNFTLQKKRGSYFVIHFVKMVKWNSLEVTIFLEKENPPRVFCWFHFVLLYFFTLLLCLCGHHMKQKVCEFLYSKRFGKFRRFSIGHFIKHKTSYFWRVTDYKLPALYLKAAAQIENWDVTHPVYMMVPIYARSYRKLIALMRGHPFLNAF